MKASSSLSRKDNSMMRIRNFPLSINEQHVDGLWDSLRDAIREIQRKNNSCLSFEELYRNAYTMVLHKRGKRLYSGLQEVVTEHLVNKVRADVLAAMSDNFLYALNAAWNEHQTSMVMIRDILMYMDRVYVQGANCDNVYDLGLKLFRDEIVRYGSIGTQLRQTLLDLVTCERNGQLIDRTIIKSTCQMLIVLGVKSRHVYEEDFECHFIRQSANFYASEARRLFDQNLVPTYLEHVVRLFAEERTRVATYLDPDTDGRIVEKLEQELIANHMADIVHMPNSGLVFMLANDRLADMRRMYELLARVDGGHREMTAAASRHLRLHGAQLVGMGAAAHAADAQQRALLHGHAETLMDTGGAISAADAAVTSTGSSSGVTRRSSSSTLSASVGNAATAGAPSQPTSPIDYIQSLLNLKERYDLFLQNAFAGNRLFKQSISSDFEYFLNLNDRSAEYLSLYIDDRLRRGKSCNTKSTVKSAAASQLTDSDVERILDCTMILFRFLTEKDTFEEYYKRHLSRRLLNQKCASDDWERLMIGKLKTECGCHFTHKLEGMFKDIAVSKDINEEFRLYTAAAASGEVSGASPVSTAATVRDSATGEASTSESEAASHYADSPIIDLNVRVLTTGFWPGQTAVSDIRLPAHVVAAFDRFKAYYLTTKSGRVLKLQPASGTVDMLAYFQKRVANESASASHSTAPQPAVAAVNATAAASTATTGSTGSRWQKHLICVTTHQMAILMLFNDVCRETHDGPRHISFRAICDQTKLSDRDVVRSLQPLAVGKMGQRFLAKLPRSKEIETGEVAGGASGPGAGPEGALFTVNDNFNSSFYRIKVQQMASNAGCSSHASGGGVSSCATNGGGVSSSTTSNNSNDHNAQMHRRSNAMSSSAFGGSTSSAESEAERAETRRRLDDERKHEIEACVVRIMKARKTLSHSELVSEVIAQLNRRFLPSPATIKKRIETLIEREYIRRSDANRTVYVYVA